MIEYQDIGTKLDQLLQSVSTGFRMLNVHFVLRKGGGDHRCYAGIVIDHQNASFPLRSEVVLRCQFVLMLLIERVFAAITPWVRINACKSCTDRPTASRHQDISPYTENTYIYTYLMLIMEKFPLRGFQGLGCNLFRQ